MLGSLFLFTLIDYIQKVKSWDGSGTSIDARAQPKAALDLCVHSACDILSQCK